MSTTRGARRFGLALRALRKAAAARKTPLAIIGGIALNANGVARFTADIDATIPGADLDLMAFLRALRTHGIVPRVSDPVKFARAHQVLLLEHETTGLEVDLSLAWISSPTDRETWVMWSNSCFDIASASISCACGGS